MTCLRCVTPSTCSWNGCSPGTARSEVKRLPREPSAEMLAAVRKKLHPTRPDGWDSVHAELWRKMWDAAQ